MKRLAIFAFLLGSTYVASSQSQYVSGIYTDFQGWWTSSKTSINPIEPDSSHVLLGFTYNGTDFSTGVDDAKLTANGVVFTDARFRALDLPSTINLSSVGFQMGSRMDGDITVAAGDVYITVDGVTAPLQYSTDLTVQRAEAARLLEDGVKGLNLGTGLINLPDQTVTFELPAAGLSSKYNDGIPDLLFTQVASPSPTLVDSVCLADAAGLPMGIKVGLNFIPESANRIAYWRVDVRRRTNGDSLQGHIRRSIQMVALDFVDFGLTEAQASLVEKVIFDFNSLSDMAFMAYNERSFVDCATAGVTLTTIAPVAASSPAALNGEMVPGVSGGISPYSLRQVGTTTLIPSTDWDEFRSGVYMMEAVDDLGCASSTAVRVMIPNTGCNTPG